MLCPPGRHRSSFNDVALRDCQNCRTGGPYRYAQEKLLERQDLSRTYLAHHELERDFTIINIKHHHGTTGTQWPSRLNKVNHLDKPATHLDTVGFCLQIMNLQLLPPDFVSQLLLLVSECVCLAVQPPVHCMPSRPTIRTTYSLNYLFDACICCRPQTLLLQSLHFDHVAVSCDPEQLSQQLHTQCVQC